jgi:hypothetical protein
MFARRREHGVLDSIQDDLRIDAFLFTEHLDGLIDRSHVKTSSLKQDL